MNLSRVVFLCTTLAIAQDTVNAGRIVSVDGNPCAPPAMMEHLRDSMEAYVIQCDGPTEIGLIALGYGACNVTDEELAPVCTEPACDLFFRAVNQMDPIHCDVGLHWVKPVAIRLKPLCDSVMMTAPVPVETSEPRGGGAGSDSASSLPSSSKPTPQVTWSNGSHSPSFDPSAFDPFVVPKMTEPVPTTETPPTPRPTSRPVERSQPQVVVLVPTASSQGAPLRGPQPTTLSPPPRGSDDPVAIRPPFTAQTPSSTSSHDAVPGAQSAKPFTTSPTPVNQANQARVVFPNEDNLSSRASPTPSGSTSKPASSSLPYAQAPGSPKFTTPASTPATSTSKSFFTSATPAIPRPTQKPPPPGQHVSLHQELLPPVPTSVQQPKTGVQAPDQTHQAPSGPESETFPSPLQSQRSSDPASAHFTSSLNKSQC